MKLPTIIVIIFLLSCTNENKKHFYKGKERMQKSQYETAIEEFDYCISLYPKDDKDCSKLLRDSYEFRIYSKIKLKNIDGMYDDYVAIINYCYPPSDSIKNMIIQTFKDTIANSIEKREFVRVYKYFDFLRRTMPDESIDSFNILKLDYFIQLAFAIHEAYKTKNYSKIIYYSDSITFKTSDSTLLSNIKVRKQLAQAFYEIGNSYEQLKSYENALNNYELGKTYDISSDLKFNQSIIQLSFLLAQYKEKKGEYSSAIFYYKEILKFLPNNTKAMNMIPYLEKLMNCETAKELILQADEYVNKIDWDIMERVNGIIKNYSSYGSISDYDKETLKDNWNRVIDMTQYIIKAHDNYIKAMNLSKNDNCSDINNNAFKTNMNLMNNWMFKSSEIIMFLNKLIKKQEYQ